MSYPQRVLVTGSAGRIGRAAVRELKARGHFVRGFDLLPSRVPDESIVGSITDGNAVHQAAIGMNAIIHLAATPDDDDFVTKLLPNNLLGTHNALEAARLAGVKRVILASSGQVVWWQRFRGPWPIGIDAQPSPRGWYAATKMFVEGAGRSYSELHGLSVIAARFGWCPRDRCHLQQLAGTDWAPNVYLSPGDAGRFNACAVEASPEIKFAVVYVSSWALNTEIYDLAPTKRLVGFEPHDTWPQGAEDDLSSCRA